MEHPPVLINCLRREDDVWVRAGSGPVRLSRGPSPTIIDTDTDLAPMTVIVDGQAVHVESGEAVCTAALELPRSSAGVMYLVDVDVLLRFPDRSDLVAPAIYDIEALECPDGSRGLRMVLARVHRHVHPVPPEGVPGTTFEVPTVDPGMGAPAPRPWVVARADASDAVELRRMRLTMLGGNPHAFDVDPDATAVLPWSYWRDWAAASEAATDRLVVLAWVGARSVGMIAAHVEGDAVHAGALWVEPSWRGRGIAAELLDEIDTWAHDVRATRVLLGVAADNPARVLYESRGFRATGESRPTRWGGVELEMAKPVGS